MSFISTQTDKGEQATPAYAASGRSCSIISSGPRASLLDDRAAGLRAALQAQDAGRVAALTPRCRARRFGEVRRRAERHLAPAIRDWVAGWLADAKRRGQEVSPYPDAIDFKAAGIVVAEYAAMTGVGRFFDLPD